jgi:hypothetical protein
MSTRFLIRPGTEGMRHQPAIPSKAWTGGAGRDRQVSGPEPRLDGLAAVVGGFDEDRGLTSATAPYYSLALKREKNA